MISPLSYLWYRIRYPSKKIFIHEGLGIEARYERCKVAWESHLQNSKRFIKNNLKGENLNVVILGAGTLLDCDLASIASESSSITLVDINPRAASTWPRKVMNTPVKHVVSDVTGTIDRWRDIFKRSENFLNQQFSPTIPAIPQGDVIISLNLQSQFPVLLKEIMKDGLKRFSIYPDDHEIFPSEYESLWEELSGALQSAHRKAVFEKASKSAFFLFDTDYFYRHDNGTEPHSAVFTDLINPEAPWKLSEKSSWEWHIAPRGEVSNDYEVIHHVRAEAWSKGETSSGGR